MIKVMAFGSFDIFHKGHEYYLSKAKSLGDELTVVVSRDQNIIKMKNKEPLNNQENRLLRVYEFEAVDKAILGNKKDMFQVIVDEKPAVICLGYDQWANEDNLIKELFSRGISGIKIVRIDSFEPETYKSSKLKK
jgi:FAD synthetase